MRGLAGCSTARSWSAATKTPERERSPGQLAAALESSDLGRRLLLRIHPGFVWSDGSRPVSAIDVARDLVDRTDPNSPRYEARWAELLDRVEITDLTQRRRPFESGTASGRALAVGTGRTGPRERRRPGGDRRARSSARD